MQRSLLALAFCLLPLGAWAEDYTVLLRFPKAQARDVLRIYEKLSAKPVYMALGLDEALVTIESEREIPSAEAVQLIRKTLLERYGIELRENERGETLAGWSKDPKYPRRSDAPMTKEELKAVDTGRLRVIKP